MAMRYQDVYPEPPLLDSDGVTRPSAATLLSVEYFEAAPGDMPAEVFAQHHILLNLREDPHPVENWRDGVHRTFDYRKDEVIVTPAGVRSGWRWREKSKVIVVTLEPEALERFAMTEVGVVLTGRQLADQPQFHDPDLVAAGVMLRDALADGGVGSAAMFEALARVFLVKLIQRYGEVAPLAAAAGFTPAHYKRVLDYVADRYAGSVTLEEMAGHAGLSASRFARVFKEAVGRTPMQFVAAYRVERAKTLLQDRAESLSRIAHATGFADQAHFTRVFKQHVGDTPGAWRDLGRAKG